MTEKNMTALTRTEMRIFMALREYGQVSKEDHRWLTYQPLLDAGLCYESEAGWLRISPRGEAAIILQHRQVLA